MGPFRLTVQCMLHPQHNGLLTPEPIPAETGYASLVESVVSTVWRWCRLIRGGFWCVMIKPIVASV